MHKIIVILTLKLLTNNLAQQLGAADSVQVGKHFKGLQYAESSAIRLYHIEKIL